MRSQDSDASGRAQSEDWGPCAWGHSCGFTYGQKRLHTHNQGSSGMPPGISHMATMGRQGEHASKALGHTLSSLIAPREKPEGTKAQERRQYRLTRLHDEPGREMICLGTAERRHLRACRYSSLTTLPKTDIVAGCLKCSFTQLHQKKITLFPR